MQVERANSNELLVDTLPDGSKVIINPTIETLFSLNATAGAVWDACSRPTTLSRVAEDMRRSFDAGITEELALEAIQQLQDYELVTTTGSSCGVAKREVFAKFGAIALPRVVSLPIATNAQDTIDRGSRTASPAQPPIAAFTEPPGKSGPKWGRSAKTNA